MHMIGDGNCDPACNVFDCAHDAADCTRDQIKQHCLNKLSDALVSPPLSEALHLNTTRPQVWMQVSLDPLVVVVNDDTKQTHIDVEASRRMLWQDKRLFDPMQNPCVALMSGLITMSREEAEGDASRVEKAEMRSRFWIPDPIADNLKDPPRYLLRAFRLSNSLREFEKVIQGAQKEIKGGFAQELPIYFREFNYTGTGIPNFYHVQYYVEEEITVKQRHFDYWYFPFDRQQMHIMYRSNDFDISTCGSPVDGGDNSFLDQDSIDELLPSHGDFAKAPCGEVDSAEFTGDHATMPILTRKVIRGCELVICIRRIPSQYIQMYLVPQSLVVIASLLAMAIPPGNAGDASARTSVLFIALLLLAETGSGIWRGTYLDSWVDLTNLVQICILAIAVIETWIMYALAEQLKRPALSSAIDGTFRVALPLIYILVLTTLILVGLQRKTAGFVFLLVSLLVLAVALAVSIKRSLRLKTSYRMRLVHKLRRTNDNEAERTKIIEKLFRVFDVDETGALETLEAQQLCKLLYPQLSRSALRDLMTKSDWLNRNEPSIAIHLEEFTAALNDWEGGLARGDAAFAPSAESPNPAGWVSDAAEWMTGVDIDGDGDIGLEGHCNGRDAAYTSYTYNTQPSARIARAPAFAPPAPLGRAPASAFARAPTPADAARAPAPAGACAGALACTSCIKL